MHQAAMNRSLSTSAVSPHPEAVHPAVVADALDSLEQALQAERRALLEHDVDALLNSTQAKLAALRRPGRGQVRRPRGRQSAIDLVGHFTLLVTRSTTLTAAPPGTLEQT